MPTAGERGTSARRSTDDVAQPRGATYDAALDGPRLGAQLSRVWHYMVNVVAKGEWRTLREIAQSTGAPEASVSARLRDLRRTCYGSLMVERRRRPDWPGLHEYRVLLPVAE